MASEHEDTAVTTTASKNEEEPQTLVSRVASLSLSAACETSSTTYTLIKENLPVIDSICDVAEMRVKTIASAAVSGVQLPLVMSQTNLAASLEEPDVPTEKQRQEPSNYVDLISVSTEICQKAYRRVLRKLQETKQKVHETLSQLQQVIDLIECARQNLDREVHDEQEKLSQRRLEWGQSQSEQAENSQAEMESRTLGVSHDTAQQLQASCQILLAPMQYVRVMMQQAYGSMEELEATLSTAESFQDLSSGFLTQCCEEMIKAWEVIDETVAYVMQNAPVMWVVEPFSPCRTSAETMTEPMGDHEPTKEA
ncbi:perilipin-3-like [Tiliqua scincoides]|uniref:perilipin-3-like n=1 Tax=Tiliqua scincoides TaxID=71010 RepID=UPI003463445E